MWYWWSHDYDDHCDDHYDLHYDDHYEYDDDGNHDDYDHNDPYRIKTRPQWSQTVLNILTDC